MREEVTQRVETAAKRLRQNGAKEEWLRHADADTKLVCANVNGPLGEALVALTEYPDKPVMEVFREGGSVVCTLHAPAGSTQKDFPAPKPTEELRQTCKERTRCY